MTGLTAGERTGQETEWKIRDGSPIRRRHTTVEADIDLVLSFLNTIDHEAGTDALGSDDGWRSWCVTQALRHRGAVQDARSVRDTLRAAASDGPWIAPGTSEACLRVELTTGVPVFSAVDAIGEVLAAAGRLAVLELWDRVKICPARDCRRAFYDRSRNRSRTWCSMRICGNREKARNWRERSKITQA
ncbi:MAG: CGNR zinc finger domain-containing protein [Sciscionella sp.]